MPLLCYRWDKGLYMIEKKHTGGCMCGAIRYELDNNTTWNVYCHCESCRKHTGAPVVVLVTCSPDQIHWTSGARALYESSADRFRSFCRDCGTSLSWEAEIKSAKQPGISIKNGSWLAIHVSTFDHPEDFPASEHVFVGDSIAWFDVDDDFLRHQGSKFI